MQQAYAYVKGQYVLERDAVISIDERGFRYGDGLFETIRICNKKPYLLEYHLDRLKQGVIHLRMKESDEIIEIPQIISHLIDKNQIDNGIVRLSYSRGIGSKGYLPEVAITPTLIIQTYSGIPEINPTMDVWLEILPFAASFSYKSMQSMPYVLGRMAAQEQGCFEALFMLKTGEILETSSGNIFWLKEGILYTPSIEVGIVSGVMRRRIMELSPYPVHEGTYRLSDLKGAEVVFASNVMWPIIAIQQIKTQENTNMSFNSVDLAQKFRDLIKADQTR